MILHGGLVGTIQIVYTILMEMTKEEILELHKEYFDMFGQLPPISPDGDFYSEEKIAEIKAAIGSGRKL